MLSYSQTWGVLAAAMDGGVVALWDVRVAGERGCAAAVRMGGRTGVGASDARWVHLDDGSSLCGALLLAPASGDGLCVYDVRRVASARAPSSAVPVATLPSPAAGATVGCFAAQEGLLVVGGGAKGSDAWRYRLDGQPDEEEQAEARRGAKSARTKPARNLPAQCFKRTSRPQ